MSLSDLRFCVAGILVWVVLPFGSVVHGQSAPAKSKVLVYPTGTESVSQLKERGIDRVVNYGSYWLVEATDDQVASLKARYGDRAMKADYMNRVELAATSLDTTSGELTAPASLQESESPGKRLWLVHFQGPVRPEWMKQLEEAGKVINYIPNNAYVVWLDQNGAAKLKTQLVPQGPIQWIGPYLPSYKIQQNLLTAEPWKQAGTVTVRVAVVEDPETAQTANTIQSLGSVQSSFVSYGLEIMQADVSSPAAVSQIAQLPGVVWIEKVEPKRILDEVQDLVLAGQTNQVPGYAPIPRISGGTNYLDWLTSTVGGGLASFTNANTYPIVDIADTGLDIGDGFTAHPAFHYLGDTNQFSRVAYMRPRWLFDENATELGCQMSINTRAFKYITAEDIYGHGTFVASILAGYDAGTNILGVSSLELDTYTTNYEVSIPDPSGTFSGNITNCAQIRGANTNLHILLPKGVTNVCGGSLTYSNLTYLLTTNVCQSGIVLPPVPVTFGQVVTNSYSDVRRDLNGFQYGMGVSPFGQIGINRIWSQNVSVDSSGGGCAILIHNTSVCMNDFPALITIAYLDGARIQNNSWADVLNIYASNGGLYTSDSRTFDIGVRDAVLPPTGSGNGTTPGPSPLNQEFALVFACNSGLGDAGSAGNAGGFADMMVTAPATAKNVISVGSAVNPRLSDWWCGENDSSLDMASFSATGPTVDGRFKPEIVAPGSTIWGAVSQLGLAVPVTNCSVDQIYPTTPSIVPVLDPGTCAVLYPSFYDNLYTCANGSSFAAPAVSGGIQLLWWYFQNRLTNELGTALLQPSPAMAKAYLCNSARYLPVTNPQTGARDTLPSTLQGMGEMDLQRMFDGVPRVIRDSSAPRAIDIPLTTTNPTPQQTYFSQSGQSYEVSGQVSDPTKPFRVTLAWTDLPGSPAAFQQLVNDLDLTVTIGGQTYKGNVFVEDHSVPGGSYDGLNNMESVFLPPQTGTWKVVVQAMNIAGYGVPNVGSSLNQDFALVVYNSQTNFATLSDVPNPATNNSCATAIVIADNPFSFTNTLSKAVYHNVHPSPSAARGGADEFFKLAQPTAGGVFTIRTAGSTFDNVLSVWKVQVLPQPIFVRGECGALTEVTSANGGLSSTVTFTADGSNDYYVVAEPHNDGSGGTLVLNVSATAPAITITPSHLAFPDTAVGYTSAVQTVTYRNNTTVNIGISSVSIAGPDAADFVIESDGCAGSVVRTGMLCTVDVAFAPTAGGSYSNAQLVISDDATGSPRLVPLSGKGKAPVVVACLSTANLSFGNWAPGTTSATNSVTITNCGSGDLFITNILVDSGDYSVNPDPCTGTTISPAGTCTFGVSFTPTTIGPSSGTLTISSNATNSPNKVILTGTGQSPVPQACLSTTSINFGNQSSGTTSALHSVTITNCGTEVLNILSISLSGADAGVFILSGSGTCSNIDIGGTCSFGVSFAPTSFATAAASVIISNDSPTNPQVVTLSGSGAASQPDLLISTKKKLLSFVGDQIINTNGQSQTLTKFVRHGRKFVFYVAIRNDGNTAGSFHIHGTGDSTDSTVKYFLGAKKKDQIDITSVVEAGSFGTASMAPGAITGDATMIRGEVTVSRTAVAGTRIPLFVSGFSNTDSSKQDTVGVLVYVK
jgi:hypothetical protein